MTTLREIAVDTLQSPALMLDRLGLDADTDIDAPIGPLEAADVLRAVRILDGLEP